MSNLQETENERNDSSIFSQKGWVLFALFCCLQWLILFVDAEFVVTDDLYQQYFNSQMEEKYGSYDELSSEFEEDLDYLDDEESLSQYWTDNLIDFTLITTYKMIVISLISVFMFIGLTINMDEINVDFKTLFKVVLVAYSVFFLGSFVKMLWFILIETNYTFEDVRNFEPLSLYSLFREYELPSYIIYPLKYINLFEVLFLIVVLTGVQSTYKKSIKGYAFPLVTSYVVLIALGISLRIYVDTLF